MANQQTREEMVTSVFVNLGASPDQAEVMASQLLKRASQIAIERGISEVDAAENLLTSIVSARQGGRTPINSDS